MNRLPTNVPVLLATLALAGCAASGPAAPGATTAAPDTTKPATTTAGRASQPAEDLSKYRPKFSPPPAPKPLTGKAFVTPTASVNTLIDQRLRDQAYTNQNVKYTSGYRIQAYVGLERDEAMAIRRAVISRYPEETDYVVFKQPIYRLFIGDYATRLDAERAMLRIKPLAPKADLQPAQVLINKTRF
ncbi:SPOR domain-containing protein [Hymenobacter jeollabukensis]|uniref:SPOR domain-containing protein n=1 Tax=Hymenobacter jeollabukensis TaxID=2025313 RepID=A0A5R8WN20_9BACT|nr:SPOR domain-containing protein [Hymenobacter jeollabukensis]TLM90520.1 SPOR domain-containing protein [Hymenobacter jeollabukensis]